MWHWICRKMYYKFDSETGIEMAMHLPHYAGLYKRTITGQLHVTCQPNNHQQRTRTKCEACYRQAKTHRLTSHTVYVQIYWLSGQTQEKSQPVIPNAYLEFWLALEFYTSRLALFGKSMLLMSQMILACMCMNYSNPILWRGKQRPVPSDGESHPEWPKQNAIALFQVCIAKAV